MRSVRVLVHLNNLALGGAQLNAVDIARTLRDRGHQPVLFAQGVDGPAPLVELAAGHGLDLVVAGDPATPHAVVRARLAKLADEHGSQVVHAWEVRAARNAYFGPGRQGRLPIVTTFYGIRMLRGMPRYQPLVLGLGALMPDGRAFGHRDLRLIEPPSTPAPTRRARSPAPRSAPKWGPPTASCCSAWSPGWSPAWRRTPGSPARSPPSGCSTTRSWSSRWSAAVPARSTCGPRPPPSTRSSAARRSS
ncbi:glycosyltransferase family 4 protein [Kitasatospora saccharophila]|uniref:glycosyltransferase family 4 protein n=1 Tax=Kitasatospora saccharophila TaxID=407973 RepID=UPI003632DC8B